MMKKIFSIVIAALLVLACSGALASEQRVYDDAGLFSAEEAAILEQTIASLREEYPHDFAIHTAEEGVYDTADYADTFYEDMGFGAGEGRSGVLFFVDMESRTTFISTAGDMIDIIDDAREEEIFDTQMEYLSSGDFGGAMVVSLAMAEQYILEGVAEGHYAYDESTGEILDPSDYGSSYREDEGFSLGGLILGLGGGLAAGLIAGLIAKAAIRSSYAKKYQPVAYDFESKASLDLTVNDTAVTNKFVTTRRIPRNNNNSGSSGRSGGFGGSGVRTSSGGMRHGGGGRRF